MQPRAKLDERTSGVLLHPTSLPGPHGSGDLGPAARAFADWLAAAGQTWWQMLPVVPPGFSDSPYDSPSSFAGSPWLVSLHDLAADGLLRPDEIAPSVGSDPRRADFAGTRAYREARLRSAFERFRGPAGERFRAELAAFRAAHATWLEAWTLFSALKRAHADARWSEWPSDVKWREGAALERARRELETEIAYHEFVQFFFDRQWQRLRAHCAARNVALLGDVPMFVAYDSADVWQNPELFHLDEHGAPSVVAGVPPDAFSDVGQLWGNPLYRWERMHEDGFAWWIARLGVTLGRFDGVRLDHFIGFRRYWEIPVGAKDARTGRFVHVHGESFFEHVSDALGGLPFLAEDLGIVTDEVKALRDRFGLPGMRVLQFAFGADEPNDYRPHRYLRNAAVYTGTHDNDTTRGWFEAAPAHERERATAYVASDGREIHWDFVRAALASVANIAIFPLQDALGVGSEARMNVPGTATGNWDWRATAGEITPPIAERLRKLCHVYERTPRPHPGDPAAVLRLA